MATEYAGLIGNMACKSSAQHWCSMIQNFAEGKLENLDYELQRDALASAIALAPDLKTKAFVAEKYAIRRCKIEGTNLELI